MLLQLKYSEKTGSAAKAAIIPGSEPLEWLREISRWSVDPDKIRCFILPENIHSPKGNGLFVLFQRSETPPQEELRHPYTEAADGFYIPVNSYLFPDIHADELKELKLWSIQVFHPAAGLIGYDQSDELSLVQLIDLLVKSENNWLQDFPAVKANPHLRSISLEVEEQPLDAMDALESLIDKHPLSEIPKDADEKNALLQKLFNLLGIMGLWLLLILAFIGKIIFHFLSALFGTNKHPTYRPVKEGPLQQLEKWINSRLKDLQKQRESELNRLVKLFDKNKDEALQYAIPLNSPYLNRGTAPKSGKLTRWTTSLNLRGFGSGGRVDAWDLGEFRNTLRQRYIDTANAAIAQGDYKKAAYIYAHLLGDLHMAAITLQNGKHYREAAAIYKDHLNNRAKAAECLESGGLLAEAIPIYVDLGSYEKAGDLHTQLGQGQYARKYYEDIVSRSLGAKDYINASRITMDKLHDQGVSRDILLSGWKDDNQPEACLKKYFETVNVTGEQLDQEIKAVYKDHVVLRKKTGFLNVLADIIPLQQDEQLRQTALSITYEIVHQQMNQGDHTGLRLLNRFLPADRLVGYDINRYILQNHQQHKAIHPPSYIELRQDTRWVNLVNYNDQILGIGIKNEELHLVRLNWDGKAAYEFLFNLTGELTDLRLLADGYLSPMMILLGHSIPLQTSKKLEAYSYFEKELYFKQLNWVLPHTIAYGLKSERDELFILHVNGDDLCLDEFSEHGQLLRSASCTIQGEKVSIYDMPFLRYSAMYWRKDHFYLIGDSRLIRIDIEGHTEILKLDGEVLDFAISNPYAALKIALITSQGCLMINPGLKEMTINGSFFAIDTDARFIQLLPDNKLVVASRKTAFVYDLSGGQPKLICDIQPENLILKILTVPKRHHFALLEADNRISIHQLNEE